MNKSCSVMKTFNLKTLFIEQTFDFPEALGDFFSSSSHLEGKKLIELCPGYDFCKKVFVGVLPRVVKFISLQLLLSELFSYFPLICTVLFLHF